MRPWRHAGDKDAAIALLGEAKATNKPRTMGDLARLETIRQVLSDRGHNAEHAVLAVFGRSGFHQALVAEAAQRTDVRLVDLDVLYGIRNPAS